MAIDLMLSNRMTVVNTSTDVSRKKLMHLKSGNAIVINSSIKMNPSIQSKKKKTQNTFDSCHKIASDKEKNCVINE